MKVNNLDTIEFIFNFYFVAWLFLGYEIMQVVQKILLIKRL